MTTEITISLTDPSHKNNSYTDCSTGFFRCKDGKCIIDFWRCNGIADCARSEDESFCDEISECLEDEIGVLYRGRRNVTASGIPCQHWSSTSPHDHSYLFNAENYCRNSEKANVGPWCYTQDTNVRWDYCDIPVCSNASTASQLETTTMKTNMKTTVFSTMINTQTSNTELSSETFISTEATTIEGVTEATCNCLCQNFSQFSSTPMDLKLRLAELDRILRVNKYSTNLNRRTKTSAADDRVSSKSFGYISVLLLIGVVLFIVFLDVVPKPSL
ncbi:apolipoprotein(a)-like [Mytilus californianus]|uniref:apolipoprotein(a)-like n=1 Tax=Mytilus californianus TaxID=6549 RepID=UPI002245651F|nr:apolipoprotein(a)-like [Mytilus californianus]